MNLTIRIDPDLGHDWYGKVEHLVDLELSSLSHRISTVDINLSSSLSSEDRLKGRVRLETKSGREFIAVTVNSDPRACVLDALRRLKRDVIRQVTLPGRSVQQESV